MKVAMLTSDYLPNIGGIASHIHELSKALITLGHEVEVWLWDRKGVHPSVEAMGEVPVRVIPGGDAGELSARIEEFLSEFGPQVIHVHTLDPLIPATSRLRKKYSFKAVWTNHSSRYLRKIDSFFWRLKMKHQIRRFDGILATSRDRMEKSLCLGIPKACCRSIPSGIDPDRYEVLSKEEARKRLNIPEDRFVLLYTGRFAPIKGVFHLARAMFPVSRKIPNVLCVMCGNMEGDRESQKVRSFIRDNNLENYVRMEGFVRNDLLGPYLYACDCLILPSLMEATSISAMEAMSAARPVIGSRVGGIPELVQEGVTGILVNPGDEEALAGGIEKFWKMPDGEAMGLRAREKVVNHFTWHQTAKKVEEFYLSLDRSD